MDVNLDDDTVEGLLRSADVARARGGEVLPQVACQAEPNYYNLRSGFAYEALPEPWGEIYLLSHEERLARFQDPETLDRLEQAAKEQVTKGDNLSRPADFDGLVLSSTSGEYAKYVGRTFGEIGKEWGCTGFRALVEDRAERGPQDGGAGAAAAPGPMIGRVGSAESGSCVTTVGSSRRRTPGRTTTSWISTPRAAGCSSTRSPSSG